MGLNDAYDHVRNRILLLNPLPTVNKAYSMILRVKKQREVHNVTELTEASAMLANNRGNRRFDVNKARIRNYKGKKGYLKKEDKYYNHCHAAGHMKDNCFKIHRYPDWYKEIKQKKTKPQAYVVTHRDEAAMDEPLSLAEIQPAELNPALSIIIQ